MRASLRPLREGDIMPGTQIEGQARAAALPEPKPGSKQRSRYIVLRRGDAWFIIFTGKEFGPYKSEREAKLFAIDAAYKLAEQGEESEVLVVDEGGAPSPVWIGGRDPYPPRD
jgi:hypothetical protein